MNALAQITTFWPSARRIRDAGSCPNCRLGALWSFQTDLSDGPIDAQPGWEYCGYWCERCGFSNAGARLIEEAGA